jgi:hypothetical protein
MGIEIKLDEFLRLKEDIESELQERGEAILLCNRLADDYAKECRGALVGLGKLGLKLGSCVVSQPPKTNDKVISLSIANADNITTRFRLDLGLKFVVETRENGRSCVCVYAHKSHGSNIHNGRRNWELLGLVDDTQERRSMVADFISSYIDREINLHIKGFFKSRCLCDE